MPPPTRMHDDQFDIDDTLVARLVSSQFPRWAHLPLRRVDAASTVNAIFRLGEELAVRLPIRPGQAVQFEKDRRWLPRLAPRLPLAIPEPLEAGQPTEEYPSEWAIYRWLPGQPASLVAPDDPCDAARRLAEFVLALRSLDTTGAPRPSSENYQRGGSLRPRDPVARRNIAALEGTVDTARMTAVWEAALAAPEWDRAPVWVHGDLMPGNLLVHEGRLSAVIDFGALVAGDPAGDVVPAWGALAGVRDEFRAALDMDHATWARGRGRALWPVITGLPYYRDTNPGFVAVLEQILEAILSDPDVL